MSTPTGKGANNNGQARPLDPGAVPPELRKVAADAGVDLGAVKHEVIDNGGRPLEIVLAWLYVTCRDRRAGKIDGEPAAYFRGLCRSGKAPPDRDYALAKEVLSTRRAKDGPDLGAEFTAWLQAHSVQQLEAERLAEIGHNRHELLAAAALTTPTAPELSPDSGPNPETR